MNAVEYVVLPGAVNKETRRRVLEEIERCDCPHFLVLFRDSKLQFRALYAFYPDTEEVSQSVVNQFVLLLKLRVKLQMFIDILLKGGRDWPCLLCLLNAKLNFVSKDWTRKMCTHQLNLKFSSILSRSVLE